MFSGLCFISTGLQEESVDRLLAGANHVFHQILQAFRSEPTGAMQGRCKAWTQHDAGSEANKARRILLHAAEHWMKRASCFIREFSYGDSGHMCVGKEQVFHRTDVDQHTQLQGGCALYGGPFLVIHPLTNLTHQL